MSFEVKTSNFKEALQLHPLTRRVVVGGDAYSTRIQSDVATDRLSISVASGRIDRQTREMPRPRLGIWYKTLIGEPLIPL